ncbi:type II secretion system protein GspC [Marinospirillum perlucidum]|uniref:type II secretion system protein GspC n=1 Tax=Marinospirillum perlucidum TaxID=1982602 RepID=UPI000DF257BA|nr:type II secretion system protein GspC [Marinospirillum perlucidum]
MPAWLPVKSLLQLSGWLLVAWMSAHLTWTLLLYAQPSTQARPASTSGAATPAPVIWPDSLASHWLASSSPAPEVEERVQPSRLAVQVQGLFYSSRAEASLVVLKYQNQTFTLAEGDPLETGITLVNIRPQALVFRRHGQLEQVDLNLTNAEEVADPSQLLNQEDSEGTASNRQTAAPEVSGQAQTSSPRTETAPQSVDRELRVGTRPLEDAFGPDFRESLVRDPLQLMRHVTLVPHSQEGELQGYRLRPGSDPNLFQALGLEENDLLVAVEGNPVSDSSQMMQLHSQLATARSLEVELLRKGERLRLSLEME